MANLPANTGLPSNNQFSDPSLNRFFLTPEEKQSKERGKQIVQAFYKTQTQSDNLNFFRTRNARWIEILLWAKGSQRMQEFMDYMNVSDANKAWVNIDTTQQRLAAKFVGVLVESMAKNYIYPCVDAIDDGSLNEKEERLFEALYRMYEVETIRDMQEQAGMQLEPHGVFVPDDELSARVYFELQDRLSKEIRFEEMLAKLQNDIHFDKVINRKTLYDLIVLNFGCTKIDRVAPQQYTVRKCIPNNMVYNFFMNDVGACEITQIGEFYNLKVRDLRSRFGEQNIPGGLTEKQIYDLAKLSSHKAIGTFNYMWNDTWAMSNYYLNRPYDDCNVLLFDCEIDCGEDVYFVAKKDNYGKENITPKNGVPYQTKDKNGKIVQQDKPEDVEIIKRSKNTWMRGVYAPYGDVMLYWGQPDIIISPYTNTYKSLSSYTVNIPNNDGEYVPSLFERCLEPLREYTLTKLKRKQLIAKLTPTGYRIDIESARNIDLGNGDTVSWEEIVRIKDQTGVEVWSSKGINPLEPQAPPISPASADDTIQKIIGLTNILQGIAMEIRDVIGVPMYRDGSDVGDRTSAKLAESQVKGSYNTTDFIQNGNMQLWEETFYKICLLHWNDVVKQEPESKNDLLNTRFDVRVKMKISEYEKELLEADIQRFSQMQDSNGQPLITPKDAMMIRQIDNYKLAIMYLQSVVDENRKKAIQDSERLQLQNQQVQQASAKQAADQAKILQDEKIKAEKDLAEFQGRIEKEKLALTAIGNIAAKGLPLPTYFSTIVNNLIPNISIPLQQENKEMAEDIQQNEMMEEAAEQQQMQQQQTPMQGQPQGQPMMQQ